MSDEATALQRAIVLVRMKAKTFDAASPVPSPCISICRMSEHSGWCEGCFRSRAEIGEWSRSDDARKRELWAVIEQRMAALER